MTDKPAPIPTPETEPFWSACARGVLSIQWCDHCAAHFFYPRPACPRCGSVAAVRWVEASGRARLHSYVISHLRAQGFDPPYVIAIVELEEGPRLLTNIVGVDADPAALTLDMPVVADFEHRGGATVPVFRPAEETAAA